MKNLHTRKTSNGSNLGWLIRQMSINQKSGRQTFRRRFVSGSLFVSPCPPECNFQSEIKIEPDLRLTTGRKCLETNKGVTSIFFMNINKQESIGDISFPSIIANIYSRFHCFVHSAGDFSPIFRHARKTGRIDIDKSQPPNSTF